VLGQLQQVTAALTQAEQNRILKGAIAQAAESGNAEMLSGLAGNSVGVNPQSMNNSLALIQNLRQQQASQQAALQEAEEKYGSSYPKLVELRGSIAGLDHAISQEVERIRGRAKSDYAVAVQTAISTRGQYEQAKQQAAKVNDKAIEFAIVRQEADESRGLYEDLLKRLKEAGVLEGLRSSNITVVDPGRIPAKPKTPNVPLYMAIGFGGGLFLGCFAALLLDTLDNKIKSIGEAEELTGQSLLGATPFFDAGEALGNEDGKTHFMSLDKPHSTFTEAVRSIRTALMLTGGGNCSRVILVTSSIPREGKTIMSSNLAVVLAQSGHRVLLVDMDLRKGSLRPRLNLPSRPGLSELLAGQQQVPGIHPVDVQPQLDILQSGTVPPNPAELLSLKSFQQWISEWRKSYDFIVLDAPPLLPVTDALIVNPFVDITLLVVRIGLTERAQLQRSFQLVTHES
jgi:capsular exopolysaccharide synthesis family protein